MFSTNKLISVQALSTCTTKRGSNKATLEFSIFFSEAKSKYKSVIVELSGYRTVIKSAKLNSRHGQLRYYDRQLILTKIEMIDFVSEKIKIVSIEIIPIYFASKTRSGSHNRLKYYEYRNIKIYFIFL